MAAPAVSVAASAALLSAPPAASVAAPDAALLCTQCFWQPRLAAADGRCAECQQWRVELNVGGIPGRSVVARKDIAEGSCILTEAPDQFYCILDPQATASSSAAADGVHRASTALGAYEQVLRQVATAYLADAPHGHVREIIDGLHCVDERTFLLHHLPRDPPEVIGLLRLAKQLHREFTRERSNPELQPESLLQLTESQFARRVYAVRPIAAGESIFISYIKIPLLRNMTLQQCAARFEDWQFVCACARCKGPPDQRWSAEWDAIEAWRTKLTAMHAPPPPPRATSGFQRLQTLLGSLWSNAPAAAAAPTPKQG